MCVAMDTWNRISYLHEREWQMLKYKPRHVPSVTDIPMAVKFHLLVIDSRLDADAVRVSTWLSQVSRLATSCPGWLR